MHQEHVLGDFRQRARPFRGDADGAGALLASTLQHHVGVGGFAGLRNRHHQHAVETERGIVQGEDGRRGQRDRNPGGHLEQVASELRGIVGSSARGQHDQARRIALQDSAQFFDRSALGLERALEHGGLLEDLVSHLRHKKIGDWGAG